MVFVLMFIAKLKNNFNMTNIIILKLVSYRRTMKIYLVNKELGKRIRKLRISQNLNVKYMADEIGILDTSYSKIEREGTNNLQTLFKIAELLNVNMVSLIPLEENSKVSDQLKDYGFATRQDLKEIVELLKSLILEFHLFRAEVKPDSKKPKKYAKK
jgi:transcriptional regulator with XRE-family HTH domain